MRGSRRNGKAKQQGVEHSFFITNTPLKDLVQPEGRGGGPAQGALQGGTTARERRMTEGRGCSRWYVLTSNGSTSATQLLRTGWWLRDHSCSC